jgi:hypothetical protein
LKHRTIVLGSLLLTALAATAAPPPVPLEAPLPGGGPLPVVPGLNSDHLDGHSSEAFALAGHLHDDRYAPHLHDHDGRYYMREDADARFLGRLETAADSQRLEGLAASAFAGARHKHDDLVLGSAPRVLVATLPLEITTEGVCDGAMDEALPNLSLSFDLAAPTVVEVSSGVNAAITGQTQTGIRIDGVLHEPSMDIFSLDGRVTFNAGWVATLDAGPHTVDLVYRCLEEARFDNSGRLIVRLG